MGSILASHWSMTHGLMKLTNEKSKIFIPFRYLSTIDLMIEKTENDLVQFGTLDKIIPYASNWPYSWETFGKGLIQNVRNIGMVFIT